MTRDVAGLPLHGVLLAGGKSVRMGVNKALLSVDNAGTPLIEHIAGQMEAIVSGRLIIALANQEQHVHYPFLQQVEFVYDRLGEGPMAGLYAALSALPKDGGYAFVTACDMPTLSSELVGHMLQEALTHNADICGTANEPFHALYHPRIAPLLERLLAEGSFRMRSLWSAVRACELDALPTQDVYTNLNTPGDYLQFLGRTHKGDKS